MLSSYCRETYGEIKSTKLDSYWKYEFHLTITTDKDYVLNVCAGGECDDIYRFNPYKPTWDDIKSIIYIREPPKYVGIDVEPDV